MLRHIKENKKDFLPLLLLGDEQESMIDRYLERGELYVLYRGERAIAVAVVTDEGNGLCELKNLAVDEAFQRQGYGSCLLNILCERYSRDFHSMQLGTGESPLTLPFYEKNGFVYSHRIPNFFTEHYDHPIIEEGVRLVDMVYLKKRLND